VLDIWCWETEEYHGGSRTCRFLPGVRLAYVERSHMGITYGIVGGGWGRVAAIVSAILEVHDMSLCNVMSGFRDTGPVQKCRKSSTKSLQFILF